MAPRRRSVRDCRLQMAPMTTQIARTCCRPFARPYARVFRRPERDPIWQTMWANRPQINKGWMEVSPGPGFDIQLDPAMLQRYRLNKS